MTATPCREFLCVDGLAETVTGAAGCSAKITFDTGNPGGTPSKLLDASRLAKSGWQPLPPRREGLPAHMPISRPRGTTVTDPTPNRPLNLDSLAAAVQALANAVDVVSSPEFAAADPRWRDILVAGVVQHFEFTFELCWKMLKRQLEREVPSPSDLDGASYRELFRLGHERGLVTAVEPWFEFRELRNMTSHTYAREKALKVASGAPMLLAQSRKLLSAIEARNRG